jgi:hypothetical protein
MSASLRRDGLNPRPSRSYRMIWNTAAVAVALWTTFVGPSDRLRAENTERRARSNIVVIFADDKCEY